MDLDSEERTVVAAVCAYVDTVALQEEDYGKLKSPKQKFHRAVLNSPLTAELEQCGGNLCLVDRHPTSFPL